MYVSISSIPIFDQQCHLRISSCAAPGLSLVVNLSGVYVSVPRKFSPTCPTLIGLYRNNKHIHPPVERECVPETKGRNSTLCFCPQNLSGWSVQANWFCNIYMCQTCVNHSLEADIIDWLKCWSTSGLLVPQTHYIPLTGLNASVCPGLNAQKL